MSEPARRRKTEREQKGLEARLLSLTQRVLRLERLAGEARRGAARSRPVREPLGSDLALVEQLRRRQGPRYGTKQMRGAVAYAGAVQFGEREYLWIREHPLPEIARVEADRVAPLLAALGHPARLVLLRALLAQARTSRELQAILGVSSPGQLYHHLKELLAAGVVVQTRRSRYEVAARRVVPVLATLAAAADMIDGSATAPPAGGGPAEEKE